MRFLNLFKKPESMRNFVFGVEDSLVSTVGFVSGVASAGVSGGTILISGIILVIVEGVSMGLGTLIASNSADEVREHKEEAYSKSYSSGIIMLVSYIIAGILILLPYVLLPVGAAFYTSIVLSLVLLFLLGVVSARYAGVSVWKKGGSVMLIGGIAIAIGVAVGSLLRV